MIAWSDLKMEDMFVPTEVLVLPLVVFKAENLLRRAFTVTGELDCYLKGWTSNERELDGLVVASNPKCVSKQ